MECDPDQLRLKLESFELDDPASPLPSSLPFTSRLAREHGWTHAQAARAIREYKRFVFLAMVAGHPVSPPEAIDHVWHLHLLYTRSYWQRMCRDLLGRELHHEPTRGGRAESEKFDDWYARTLESYLQWFGEAPPSDLWPAPDRRRHPIARWIDRARYWVIPKPWRMRPFF